MVKTISLSDEAYRTLRKLKIPGESFSDTVLRICGTKARLSEILPLYPELKGNKEYCNAVLELRRTIDKRLG